MPNTETPAAPRNTEEQLVVPGLSTMTKAQMAKLITSVWELLDEEHVPTHHGPRKRDAYSLYGRVYRALVEGECDGPRGHNAEHHARSEAT